MKKRSKELLCVWWNSWGTRAPRTKNLFVLLVRKELLLFLLSFPASAETLKVATWNLNWLTTRTHAEAGLPADVHPRDPSDFTRLAGYAHRLAADIVAFQEVDGPQAASLVFDPAQYQIVTSDQAVVQRVGLAVRRGIRITQQADYPALDVEPDAKYPLRDGLDATLALPGGKLLRVLVVHLKSGCQTENLQTDTKACVLLSRQSAPLANWVSARQKQGAAFLVLGDFNRVFDEAEPFGAALLQAAPMIRATEGFADPCWDGAAFIDHIFLGGAARIWLVPGSLRVEVFREAGEQWRSALSDHCPVSIRLHVPD